MTTQSNTTVATASMLQEIKVISVNPNLKTLGALNPDLGFSIAFSEIQHSESADKLRSRLNLLTGVNGKLSDVASSKILKVRFIFAAFMIMQALMMLVGGNPTAAMMCVVVSLSCAAGLMMRICSVATAIICGYFMAISAISGVVDADFLMIAGSSLIMAILGPGKKSVDAKMRLFAFKKLNARRIIRESEKHEISYRAFRNSIG